MTALKVEDLVVGYSRDSQVLHGVSFEIGKGEVVALIGRNGMGKTTLLKTLTGHLVPAGGRITFDGRDLTGARPHEFARAGIGYVPQGREIYAGFTVEQNLKMGAIGKPGIDNSVPDWAYDQFPILRERRAQRGGTLSGGQQQQLAIMRALIGQPSLLLLDEPSEGIQPSIVQDIGRALKRIAAERNLTVLIVEQNLELVLALAGSCLVMENGAIAERIDDVSRLRSEPELVHRYLSA